MDDKESQALLVTGSFWVGVFLLALKLIAPEFFEPIFKIFLVLLGFFVGAYFLAFACFISHEVSKTLINSLHLFFKRLR